MTTVALSTKTDSSWRFIRKGPNRYMITTDMGQAIFAGENPSGSVQKLMSTTNMTSIDETKASWLISQDPSRQDVYIVRSAAYPTSVLTCRGTQISQLHLVPNGDGKWTVNKTRK